MVPRKGPGDVSQDCSDLVRAPCRFPNGKSSLRYVPVTDPGNADQETRKSARTRAGRTLARLNRHSRRVSRTRRPRRAGQRCRARNGCERPIFGLPSKYARQDCAATAAQTLAQNRRKRLRWEPRPCHAPRVSRRSRRGPPPSRALHAPARLVERSPRSGQRKRSLPPVLPAQPRWRRLGAQDPLGACHVARPVHLVRGADRAEPATRTRRAAGQARWPEPRRAGHPLHQRPGHGSRAGIGPDGPGSRHPGARRVGALFRGTLRDHWSTHRRR